VNETPPAHELVEIAPLRPMPICSRTGRTAASQPTTVIGLQHLSPGAAVLDDS